uniref:Reverse transcriptase zinc-binding domain-containing protein n=1 Tax=Quercus lobata TaxID=97700 RepID=A0A7N2KWK8_QUELO
MDAANPSSASYAWRSIIRGREVIKKGAIWRIGDGKFVDVWADRWLPRKYSPRVLSSRLDELTDSKVCSLIDVDQKQWKIEFLQREHQNAQPGQSDVSRLKPLWQAIWNLPVPSKVKNLVWRATKNSLPTKDNLVRRKIIQNGRCDVCREHTEDVKHALYSCPKLAELWKKMSQWTHMNRARERVEVFSRHNTVPVAPVGRQPARWQPPELGLYKVNVDGALFDADNTAGLGVVIRNEQGQVMVSLSERLPLPSSVIEVEAFAA